MFVYLSEGQGNIVRRSICSDNRYQSVLEGLKAYLCPALLLDFFNVFFFHISLLGSPGCSADSPPAAAAFAVTAAAVAAKRWSQIPQSQWQAARPTGTVNMLSINSSLSAGSVIWLFGCSTKKRDWTFATLSRTQCAREAQHSAKFTNRKLKLAVQFAVKNAHVFCVI